MQKLNNQGFFRIYMVVSIVWFIYFFEGFNFGACLNSLGGTNLDGTTFEPVTSFFDRFIICNDLGSPDRYIFLLPVPLYFVFNWIYEGFKNK
jgi:hypothetical protein